MAKKSGGFGCLGTIACLVVIACGVKLFVGLTDNAALHGPEGAKSEDKAAPSRSNGNAANKTVAENKTATVAKSTSQASVIPAPSARRISADVLIGAYSANEVSADQSYKGERLAVVGYVESINKSFIGSDMYVVLSGSDDSELISVQCFFKKEHENVLAGIQKGGIYIISGRCGGLFANVSLRDCDLVELPTPEVSASEVRAKEQTQKKSEYEEKMRAARETANLKQREKSQQNRPASAANDLRLAQTFLANGDKASYQRLLRKIVAQYPETSAATEAKTLLSE